MYKILILIKQDTDTSLWQFYKENNEEYTTDNTTVLQAKLVELLRTYTNNQIRVIKDVTYSVSVLVSQVV